MSDPGEKSQPIPDVYPELIRGTKQVKNLEWNESRGESIYLKDNEIWHLHQIWLGLFGEWLEYVDFLLQFYCELIV